MFLALVFVSGLIDVAICGGEGGNGEVPLGLEVTAIADARTISLQRPFVETRGAQEGTQHITR